MEYWTCDIAGPNRKFRNGDEFLDYLKEDDEEEFWDYFEEWLNQRMGSYEMLRALEDDGRNTSYFMNQFENEIRWYFNHNSGSFSYPYLDFVFTKGDDGKASDKTASKKASKAKKPEKAPAKKTTPRGSRSPKSRLPVWGAITANKNSAKKAPVKRRK